MKCPMYVFQVCLSLSHWLQEAGVIHVVRGSTELFLSLISSLTLALCLSLAYKSSLLESTVRGGEIHIAVTASFPSLPLLSFLSVPPFTETQLF